MLIIPPELPTATELDHLSDEELLITQNTIKRKLRVYYRMFRKFVDFGNPVFGVPEFMERKSITEREIFERNLNDCENDYVVDLHFTRNRSDNEKLLARVQAEIEDYKVKFEKIYTEIVTFDYTRRPSVIEVFKKMVMYIDQNYSQEDLKYFIGKYQKVLDVGVMSLVTVFVDSYDNNVNETYYLYSRFIEEYRDDRVREFIENYHDYSEYGTIDEYIQHNIQKFEEELTKNPYKPIQSTRRLCEALFIWATYN